MSLIALSIAGPFPFAQLTLKVTLLLFMFFALWMLARHKSASFRHSILVVALASLPCLAIAQLLVPSQSLPWLEQQTVANFQDAFEYSTANDPTMSRLVSQNDLLTEPHSETPDDTDSTQSGQPSGVSFWTTRGVLLTIWLCGSTVLILRFSIAWLFVWCHVRQCPTIELDGLNPALKSLIFDGRKLGCEIRIHREAEQMPLCFGLFRSTILLPKEFANWPFADQQSVILHESAHAHRRDCLINVLAHMENALLWFHPMSWMLLRHIKSESEMACDDWAIAKGVDSVNYASALFDVTMSTRRKSTVAIVSVSMADCSPLERRMQSILSSAVPRKPISLVGHMLVAAVSISAIACLAAFHLGSSAEAQSAAGKETMTIEHRVAMDDGSIVRGELTGSIRLETTYGNANLDLAMLRSVKRLDDGRHEILAEDNSVLTGIIRQTKLSILGQENTSHIKVSEFTKITTIGNAKLSPEELTSGFLKDNISYHIRAPKGYDPAKSYPSFVFFHKANSNTKSMLEEFVTRSPEVANRYILIGINGENKSQKVDDAFNYTYVDFAGRSKYGGFPGTDRQSPALVTEAITELKDRIPISKTYIIGEGDGAFLAFSVMMNYAEMIDGVITVDGGLLIQCVPDAYEDAELIAAQRSTRLWIIHTKPDEAFEDSYTAAAHRAFKDAEFPKLKLVKINDMKAYKTVIERAIRIFESN